MDCCGVGLRAAARTAETVTVGRLKAPISWQAVLALLLWVGVGAGLRLWTGGILGPARWIALILILQFVALPISMLLHELGHALAVALLGKRTAHVTVGRDPGTRIRLGRVDVRFSLLPARGVTCGAVCRYDPAGIPWRSRGWIALAGPTATLAQLLLLALVGAALWGLGPMTRYLVVVWAVWLLFILVGNLVPRPFKSRGETAVGERDGWAARQAFARDRAGALPAQRSNWTSAAAALAPELEPAARGAPAPVPLPNLFNWFAEDARVVVRSAIEQARALGHEHLGTEHLLLGLLTNPRSRPAQALTELGVDFDATRREIERVAGGAHVQAEKLVLTMSARRMLEYSKLEARKHGTCSVRSEQMLLALMADLSGLPAQVSDTLDANRDAIREALKQRVDEDTTQGGDVPAAVDQATDENDR